MNPQNSSIRFDGEIFTLSESMILTHKLSFSKVLLIFSSLIVFVYMSSYQVTVLLLFVKWTLLISFLLAVGLWILNKIGGKWVSARLISFVLHQVMSGIDARFSTVRKELLKSIRGNVLDFGCGSGIYLKYVAKPAVQSVVAMEPNVHQHRHIKKHISTLPNLPADVTITSSFIENYPGSQLFDWIIIGNVFCEIADPATTFRELDRVLKSGGRVYFSEHIAFPRNNWRRILQNLINPYWSVVTDGCNCNRDTLDVMKAALPHWQVVSWEYPGGSFPWIGRFVVGLCVKK